MKICRILLMAMFLGCEQVPEYYRPLQFENVEEAVRFVCDERNVVEYQGLVYGSEQYDVTLPSGKKVSNWLINRVFGTAFSKFGKESIPPLIDLLGSETEYLRVGAYDVLQQKAGRYDARSHSPDPVKRHVAYEEWKAWWERNKDQPRLNSPPTRVYPAEDWDLERVKH